MLSKERTAAVVGLRLSRREILATLGAGALGALLPRAMPAFAASGGALNFVAIGDWGMPNHAREQAKVADAMGRRADQLKAAFIVSLGDNFYENGVTSVNDPKWNQMFEEVYTAASLRCPWNVVLGNHDHRGNWQAQIDYSLQSPRWHMPAAYYTERQSLPDGTSADFFYLDTNSLYTARANVPGSIEQATKQLLWLQTKLESSGARWKIVVGHHPVFSGGAHGTSMRLISLLKPMLDRHGVQAYLAGHDHDMQHIVVDDVHYVISGTGSASHPVNPIEGTKFCRQETGFLAASLQRDLLSITFVDGRGVELYRADIDVNPGARHRPHPVSGIREPAEEITLTP